MTPLRILFLGDVVGAPGVGALVRRLPALAARTGAALVVANGENAAGGLGLTAPVARQILGAGVHVITTGNHVWAKREFLGAVDRFPTVVRPANYPPDTPGRGWCVTEHAGVPVGVVNLCGRVFMDPLDCPFRTVDRLLEGMRPRPPVVVVDFHAEATSEKRAMGWYLDGRVAAVVGTHTHVATADAQVLPGGTGYITDVGMCGVEASVIGVPVRSAVDRFVTRIPATLGVAKGTARLSGAVLEVDPSTGRCVGMERVEQEG